MFNEIIKHKPVGATAWHCGCYFKQTTEGEWYQWIDGKWKSDFEWPDNAILTPLTPGACIFLESPVRSKTNLNEKIQKDCNEVVERLNRALETITTSNEPITLNVPPEPDDIDIVITDSIARLKDMQGVITECLNWISALNHDVDFLSKRCAERYDVIEQIKSYINKKSEPMTNDGGELPGLAANPLYEFIKGIER